MKTVYILLLSVLGTSLYSQNNATIPDGGFENLSFFDNGWNVTSYVRSSATLNNGVWNLTFNAIPMPANTNPAFTIANNNNQEIASYVLGRAVEPRLGMFDMVFNGDRAIRLGTMSINTPLIAESISRDFEVTCSNRFLTFRVAQVSHPSYSGPSDSRLYLRVNGVPTTLSYSGITSTAVWPTNSAGGFRFRDWTLVTVDLCDFVDSTVNLEFYNTGCMFNHDMYSFIDDILVTNNNYDTSFVVIEDNCELNIDVLCLNDPNVIQEVNNLLDNFDFTSGFTNLPQNIAPDYTLAEIDSSYNFDCKDNEKKYSIIYRSGSDCRCEDIKIDVAINCTCSPPECPDAIKVNPYLNNLAGNWQGNNSYSYNTTREKLATHNMRSGQYYEEYNSIMKHNGSYWSMDDNDNWISKETNTLIDFNGKSIESTNPLKIPSSAKQSFKNTLVNHVSSNASAQETFFLSNEDDDMFIEAGRQLPFRNVFNVHEVELPLKPNVNLFWPQISKHWHKNIERVEQSKDEFHTGVNSLKVLPETGDESYAYTQFFTCESQYQTHKGGLSYCKSSPKHSTELDITKVKFETIDNQTQCNMLQGTQGDASGEEGAYADFTHSSVPQPLINKGGDYPIFINFDNCGGNRVAQCNVYFDWNQDGDFNDNGERYEVQIANNTASRFVKIPTTALVGETRMRVVYQIQELIPGTFLNTSLLPCTENLSNTYGETEDYIIKVLDKFEPESPKNTYTVTDEDIRINENSIVNEFSLQRDKDYLLSYWVKDNHNSTEIGYIDIFDKSQSDITPEYPDRPMHIEGWHKVEKVFRVSTNKFKMVFLPTPGITSATYFDDIRIHPLDGSMKGYVYDELTQRLVSELDENNYATFYDYDEEGQLIRVRKETEKGIMTIKESRKSLKQ